MSAEHTRCDNHGSLLGPNALDWSDAPRKEADEQYCKKKMKKKRTCWCGNRHTGALHRQNISDLGKDDSLGLCHPTKEDFPIVNYRRKDFARDIRYAALVKRHFGDGPLSNAL